MGLKKWFRTWKHRRNKPIRRQRASADSRLRLFMERLEDRLAPAGATITSGPTSILIVVPATETAVVSLAGSNYSITDAAGIAAASSGGTVSGNTFTASDPASGQTTFTINDGTQTGTVQLAAGTPNIVPQTTTIVVPSGIWDLNGDNDAVDALTGSGTVTNSSGGSTALLQVGSSGSSGEFDGVITNGGTGNTGVIALTIAGQFETETLTGANTYTGTTTIDASATLQIGNGTLATGSLGGGGVNDAGTLDFEVNNASITVLNNITGGGNVVLGNLTLTETVILTGTNTYSGGTSILNGNTLQVGNGTVNGSAGTGLIDDEGALNFDPKTALTVAATITTLANTGKVAQNGGSGSSVILTGGTTWNGTTTVNAGTLQFGNATAGTPNPPTTSILDDGTLIFDLTNNVTVSANITGTGLVQQSGSATLFLTGTGNTYTGGTSIQAGTVQIGTGNLDGSIGAGPVSGNAAGALIFDLSVDFTFGYAVTTIGSVSQEGIFTTLTFDASANNSYVATFIAALSTLQIGIDGAHGSLGTGAVTNNGSLVLDRSDQITVANAISGTGTLTQSGDGTVTLSGVSTYTGTTTINSGTLLVNGSITSNVFVEGGTLGGTGTVTGTVEEDAGTLQPGTSNPGILTTGSVTLFGTYSAVLGGAIAGNGPSNYNQDIVTGAGSTITINGAVLDINAFNGFTPSSSASQSFILLNNTGSSQPVTGIFSDASFNLLPEGALISNNFLGSGKSAFITYQGGANGNSVAIIVAGSVSLSGSNLLVKQTASGDLQVYNGATLLLSQPVASVTALNLSGNSAAGNSLTLDFTGGQAVIPNGITYTGLAGSSNRLNIVGGSFTNDIYTYTSQHSGTIKLDAQLVTYSNLTPISNTGTAANVTFNLPAAATNATLQDDGTPGNGLSQLISTNSTFEATTFNDPTNSAAIQVAASATNTITVTALPDFNAALTINGNNGTDTVNLGGSMTLGNAGGNSGNLTVTAHAVNLTATIDTTGGAGSSDVVSLSAGAGVNQTAGSLNADNLLLTGTGTFSLTQTGNHVGTLAANITGPLSYTDQGASSVGTVGTTSGVNSNGGNVVLDTGDTLTLNGNVTAAGATVTFDPAVGGVQQNLGAITAANLLLLGGGDSFLADSNVIGTFAANVAGAILLNDSSALTVATVGSTSGINTGGSDLSIVATGNLALNKAINAGAGMADLESTAAAITDGNGANTEVTALDLSLEAKTGIGSLASPIITAISALAADANAGGVYVKNTGALSIGFVDEPVLHEGVQTGGTGAIVLNNSGSVTITSSGDAVVAHDGNISITATGAGANITTGGSQTTVNIATADNNTGITLQAAGSLFLGTAGGFGNVEGGGNVALTATGNINIDEATQVRASTTAGTVTGQAGGNISLLQTTVPGAAIVTLGGAVTLTTGAFKTFTADSNAIGTISAGDVDTSAGAGNITINTDNVKFLDPFSLNAGGNVIIAPITLNRGINLGTAPAGVLGLTDTALGNIDTPKLLRIGNAADTGNIQMTAPIGATSISYNSSLSLITKGTLTQGAGDSVTETNLAAQGAGGVTLTDLGNAISQIVGATNGIAFQLVDSIGLTVGTVDGVSGINTANADIGLTADTMSFPSPVNAGAANVTLDVFTPAQEINLGSSIVGTLSLMQSDLDNVTASTLRIGSLGDTGGLEFTGQITGTTWSTLDLANGGGILDSNNTEPDITVANLALQSGNGISLDTAVSQLDFVNEFSGSVSIQNTGALTVTTVDGVGNTGNTAFGGTTFLSADSPITFAVSTASSGTLTANALTSVAADDDITLNANVTLQSLLGDVDLSAARSIIMQANSMVSATAGTVNLIAGASLPNPDAGAVLTLDGALSAVDINLSAPGDIALTALTATDTITATSTNGTIADGNPPSGTNISAVNLALSASTGIGTASDPLLTAVLSPATAINVVAQTQTGGIYLSNTGDLDIGYGVLEPFAGVSTTTSGDIVLSSTGGVFVNNAGEFISSQGNIGITAGGDVQADNSGSAIIISAAGNVTIMASGNVVTGGNSITAIGGDGNATVTAAGSILAGDFNTGGGPITSSGGNIQLTANGGDIVLTGDTFVNISGAGTITANASGNITMSNGISSLLLSTISGVSDFGPQFFTNGGAINLTTGTGDAFTAATGTFSTDAVSSNGGPINITADSMSFGAGIDAGSGIVKLDTVTKSEAINLGSTSAGALNLQNSDLSEVTTTGLPTSVLRIGSSADTGGITVNGAITAPSASPGTWSVLDLANTGVITDNGTGSLTVPDLALQAAGGVAFTSSTNLVTTLAGLTTNQNFIFVNSADLTVGVVDGVTGIQAGSGSVGLTALTGALNIDEAVAGTRASIGVDLSADDLNINATGSINGGASIVEIQPVTASQTITLGTKPGSTLGLLPAELGRITAGVLLLGNSSASNSGAIQVTAPISAPAGWSTLYLVTQGTITQTLGSTLQVADLFLFGASGVNLSEPGNQVSVLAGTSAAASFTFSDGINLTIGAVTGASPAGILTNGGAVSITLAAGKLLTVNSPIDTTALGTTATGANISLTADKMALNAAVKGGTTGSTSGVVTLTTASAAQIINLGGSNSPTQLGLSDAELGKVWGSVLVVGDFTNNTGGIVVSASAIGTTNAAHYNSTLALKTFGDISETATASLGTAASPIGNLVLEADDVNLSNVGNAASTLAGTALTGNFVFDDAVSFTVGTVNDGTSTVVGIAAFGPSPAGQVSLTAAALGDMLTVSQLVQGSAVTYTADAMSLSGGFTQAGTGNVVLQPFTTSRDIALGTPVAGDLSLQASDLTAVLPAASAALVIGNLTVDTGNIQINGLADTIGGTMQLLTLGSISETAAGVLSVTSLRAVGGSGVTLNTAGAFNNVSILSGGTANAGAAFSFSNGNSLTVSSSAGIVTNLGGIALDVPGGDSLTVSGAVDTTNGGGNPTGANISLGADSMTFNAAVNGGTSGIVTLSAVSVGVDLGADSGNGRLVLGVPAAGLNEVTASVLRIDSTAGSVFVQGNVVLPASIGTLSLSAGGMFGIVETNGAITAGNLALQAVTGIGDGNALLVNGPINIAFSNAPSGNVNSAGNVQISSTGGMTVTSVDGIAASVNGPAGGKVILQAASPITFAVNTTSAGDIAATTLETAGLETGPEDDITVNTGITVESTGGNVNFTSGDSINIQSGSTVKSDGGTVSLLAGVGDTDADASLTINGAISATNLTINTPGNFVVTSLSVSGTLSITAGGSILDDDSSGPSALGISANTLILSAQTGIGGSTGVGVGADPELETQVSNLAATTVTGGIDISNTGALSVIGNGTVFGVTDTGASGNITLTNAGNLTIVTSGDIVAAPGAVSVTTSSGNILLGGNNGAGYDSPTGTISSKGGSVTLGAAGNLLIGDTTGPSYGNVIAGGSIALSAGGNINIDENSLVSAHGNAGTVSAVAAGNISLLATGGTLPAAGLATEGGAIILTTGAGGTLTVASDATTFGTHSIFTTRNGGNGNININADRFVLNAPGDDIDAGTGIVTIKQVSGTEAIQLGTTTDTELDLSNAELGEITAGTLRLGALANTGSITVTAAVTVPHVATLSLLTGGSISESGSGAVTVTNLDVQSAGAVGLAANASNIGNLAGSVTGAGNAFAVNNGTNTLTILNAGVDGVLGVTTNNANITLQADNLLIKQVVTPGPSTNTTNTVLLKPFTTSLNITAGTASVPGSTFGITNGGLGWITSGVTQVGVTADTGTIAITGAINRTPTSTAPTRSQILALVTGNTSASAITQSASLSVANLAVQSSGNVVLANAANSVSDLAFNNSGGSVTFFTTGGLTIASVAGLTSSVNTGTTTSLSAQSPITFAVNTTSAGTLSATAMQSAAKTGDDIAVNSGVTVSSTGGDIDLHAAGNVTLQATSVVQAATGTVNITAGFAPADTNTPLTLSLAGTVTGQTVNLADNAGAITTSSLTGAINATNLSLLATTGIGSVANPITTNVSGLVAQTGTGGVFISNTGALTIGYTADPFQGVTDTGASGTVSLTNAGSVSIIFGVNEVVAGPGNVTVSATGGLADLTTATGNGINNLNPLLQGSIVSTGGTATVQAGHDLILGSGGLGNVLGGGSIALTAGNDITLVNNSVINARGTGTVTANAGGSISLLSTGLSGAQITSQGGAINLTAGNNGAFTANAGGSGVVSTQSGGNGNITISAGSIVLDDPITAGTGTIVLNATTGGVSQAAPSTVTGGSLLLTGSGAFNLTQSGNSVATLAANITGNGSLSYVNSGNLTLATVNTTTGITSPGSVSVTSGGTLTVNPVTVESLNSTVTLSAAGNLTVQAGSTVQGGGLVTLNEGQNGGGGTLYIGGAVTGSSVAANGGAGNDSLVLDFASGATLADGLTYNGGPGTNAFTIDDFGTATAHTYTITSTAVVRDGATFNYNLVQNLTVNGSDRGDSFTVTAAPTTAVQINDGPSSNPGIDALTVTNSGTVTVAQSTTAGNGTVTVTGDQPINYVSIENLTLSGATLLKVTGVANVANTLALTATTTSEVLRPAYDSGFYTLNSGPQVNFDNIDGFEFDGFGGGDTFIVNNPTSGPDSLFAPVNGITFNSGGGGTLKIVGGSETSATYTYNPRNVSGNSGSVVLVGSPALTANYTYSGLSPLSNTGSVVDAKFVLPGGLDNNAVLASAGFGSTNLSSSLPTPNFETTTIADPTGSLTLQETGSVSQTVTLAALDSSFGAAIAVNGTNGASTTFNVQATPLGTTTTYTGGGGFHTDTVNVGSSAPIMTGGTLSAIQGALNITNTGLGANAVVVDDSGDNVKESASLTDAPGFGQLTGLGNGAAISYSLNATSSFTINGSNNGDTFLVNQTAVAAASTTTIKTGTGGDLVEVRASSSGTTYDIQGQGGAGDAVAIGSQAPSTTGGNLLGIQGAVTVENNGALSTVNIDDSADGTSQSFGLDTTAAGGKTFDRLTNLSASNAPIQWAVNDSFGANETKLVTMNGGSAGNTYTVDQVLPVGVLGGATTVDLNTGTGTDSVYTQATNGTLNVQGQNAADTVDIGSLAPSLFGGTLAGIIGPVTISNSVGVTSINIDDSGDASPKSATIDTFVDLASLQTFEELKNLGNTGTIAWNISDTNSHDDTGTVTINGGSGGNAFLVNQTDLPAANGSLAMVLNSGLGADTVNVQATNAPLAVQGQQANDTVNVSSLAGLATSGGTLANINGSVSIANIVNFTTVNIDDSGDATVRTGTLDTAVVGGQSYDRLTGLGNPATITWDISDAGGNNDIGGVTINGGPAGNSYLVNQTALPGNAANHLSVTLNAGTGADTVNIRATNAPFTVQGQSDADTVTVGSAAPALGGNLGGINGAVTIANSGGLSTVTIDDSGDTAGQTATLDSTTSGGQTYDRLQGLGNSAAITWDISDASGRNHIGTVSIFGGAFGNIFNVNQTNAPGTNASALVVDLDTGTGADIVNVLATNAPLNIQGQQGADAVFVGVGTLQGILGTVNIENSLGTTSVSVNDSADTLARTADLSTFTLNPNGAYGQITGLAPAAINYNLEDTSALTIRGGSHGNTFNIDQTDPSPAAFTTTLDAGAGNDTVNVQATSQNVLYLLQGQNGTDTVNVGSAAPLTTGGTLAGIQGSVMVENQSASFSVYTTLTIDDSGDGTARSATLATAANLPGSTNTFGTLTGLGLPAGASIAWDLNDTGGNSEVQSVTVKGGSGGNTFTVNQSNAISSNQFSFLFLDSGTGNDTVNVRSVPAGEVLSIQGQNGADAVNVGSLAPATNGGNLAGIDGSVFVYNQSGATTLKVDDSGTTASTSYSLQDLALQDFISSVPFISGPVVNFSSPTANVYWNSGGIGVAGVTINGGSGGNVFSVDMTAATSTAYTVTLNTGIAADTVNVDATTHGTDLVIQGQSGADTVNLGAAANTVQNLLGDVNIENTGGATTILADDILDTTARTVVLSSFTPNSADTQGNSDVYGQISGLAPGDINYEFGDTVSLGVSAGTPTAGHNTFNINATGPDAATTVSAGNAGDTFNIQGSGLGAGSTDIFNGGTGKDTFNVSPSTSATIQINGGAPTTVPGDTINVQNTIGVSIIPSAGQGNGTVTFTADGDSIAFTSIENFSITNSSIIAVDTTDAEVLHVFATSAASGSYQFTGQPLISFTNATSFTYAGDNDGDTLNVQNPTSGPDTLFAPSGGITFTGALGGSLNIMGGSETSASYDYNPDNPVGTHKGTIDLVSGALDAHYVYGGPNASPASIINTGTVTDVTLDLPQGDGDNQATLASGGAGFTLLTSGKTTFASTKIADPTHALTLNAGNDGETVTLAQLDATFAAAITLSGGTGNDTFNLQATPALAPTTNIVGGGGTDTVDIGTAGSVQFIAGPVNVENPGGSAAVTVDDSADAANHTNIVLSSFTPNSADSEANADAYGQLSGLAPAKINYEMNDTTTFTLNAGSGLNIFTINQALAASSGLTTTVNTGTNSNDVVNVLNTSASGTYDIRTQGTASSTINIGAAGSVRGIQGTVNVENTGGGTNVIVVDDSADAVARTVALSTLAGPFAHDAEADGDVYGQISGLAPAALNYEYADTAGLTVKDGSGGNTFDVEATGPNINTLLDTGAGNDIVNVGDGNGTLDSLAGSLTIDGQAHGTTPLAPAQTVACANSHVTLSTLPVGDIVNFSDGGSGIPASYNLSATSLTRTGGAASMAPITFSNVQTIDLTTGNTTGSATNINVAGTPDASTTTINTTKGTAVVSVVSAGVGSALVLNAGAPANNVTIHNTGNSSITAVHGGSGTNTITLLNTGAGSAGVLLDAGTGTDTMNIEGAAAGSLIQVTGTGTNTVNVGSNPINPATSKLDPILASEICVAATTLNLDDHGSTTAHAYLITDTEVQRDGGTLFENMGIQALNLNAGSGANTILVTGTTSGTTTTVNAGSGTDTIDIQATSDTLNINGEGGTDTVSVTNAGSVQGISGTVNIENPAGSTALTVNDSVDPNPQTVTMTTLPANPSDSQQNADPYGQISGLSPQAAINYEYADTTSLTVLTGPGGLLGEEVVNVMATGLLGGSTTTQTMLIATGPTTINVGGDANVGAQNILGPLFLQNTSGPGNVITLDDSNDPAGQNVVLDVSGSNGLITGMSPGQITYALGGTDTTNPLTLLGGDGGNTFTATNVQVPMLITGGAGSDTLIGPNQFNVWTIPDDNQDINSGTMSPTNFPFPVNFTNIANLTGGSADDIFQFNEGAQLTGTIDGGGGHNWLDYSGIVTTFVDVNLTAGTADGTGAVTNIQNVIGSALGGDTIVGAPTGGVISTHFSGNTLVAGSGPTILIGGYGRNQITGGAASDLLINGRTTYDPDLPGLAQYAKLDAIFQEWSSGAAYLTRVHTIKGKTFSDPLIYGTTVIAFPGIKGGIGPRFGRGGGQYDSTLTGNASLDWFITKNAIDVIDPQKHEIITDAKSPDPAPTFTTYYAHGGTFVLNLAGSDGGVAPSALSGTASLYDPKQWTVAQPMLTGVSFAYDPVSQNLTLKFPTTLTGAFRVFLWDSQGQLFKTFLVQVKDQPPTITAVHTQTLVHGKTTLTVKNFHASDPDGDAITVTAVVSAYQSGKHWIATTANPPGFAVTYDPVNHLLSVTRPAIFKGNFKVTVTASDGTLTNQETFEVEAK